MCGIIGIWQKDGNFVSEQLLIRMRDTMYSRGPDDAGLWIDKAIGFGHRRLSILDLSALGHQPMIDEETDAVIIYNGEVYNYKELKNELEKYGFKFKGQSDTEVILSAYKKWGVACVNKFMGMFAFAIWDPKAKGIFLARDRMGIKPLYYYGNANLFMFASSLKALVVHSECPAEIDPDALGLYLEMRFIPAPWTILKGVKKLKPGHTLWVNQKGIKESCYWSLDSIKINEQYENIPEAELVDELDRLLQESVKRHLISDVPLGAFLSGGIDSSLIVAIMSRLSSSPVKVFTIGFTEKQYDESAQAMGIAKYLGVNFDLEVMKSNDLLNLLDENSFQYDEPFADSSSLPTMMVSRFAKRSVTVSLSGDGGDELFAGYPDYFILPYMQHIYRLPSFVRFAVGYAMEQIGSNQIRTLGQCLMQTDISNSFTFMRSITKGFDKRSIYDKGSKSLMQLYKERSSSFSLLDEISKDSRLDAAYFLPDDILHKLDVASMSTSLEARVPILDHKVVEFAFSLPVKYKIRGLSGKWILKQVLAKYLPQKLFGGPKKGFIIPMDKWFKHELKDMIRDELSPSRIKGLGYLNPIGVENLLNMHLSNKRQVHSTLWALLILVRWKDNHKKWMGQRSI